jgi:hypothetical protein
MPGPMPADKAIVSLHYLERHIASVFRRCVVVAVLLVVVGPARPRPTALLPPRPNGKLEAATAVVKLLMMGVRMAETC